MVYFLSHWFFNLVSQKRCHLASMCAGNLCACLCSWPSQLPSSRHLFFFFAECDYFVRNERILCFVCRVRIYFVCSVRYILFAAGELYILFPLCRFVLFAVWRFYIFFVECGFYILFAEFGFYILFAVYGFYILFEVYDITLFAACIF